jgi:hypothetical protein
LDELKDLLAAHCDVSHSFPTGQNAVTSPNSLSFQKARYQKLEKAEILEMCVDFVKQTNGHLNTIKQKYEMGYQQCTTDVATFLHATPEIPIVERQRLLNHLSTGNNRRYQPYRVSANHHSIVNDWFHRCGGGKQKNLADCSASERSNTASPSSSLDDHSEHLSSSSSSSLWRPW